MGGGVCGAIFKAAGDAELKSACDKLAPWTGEAVITPGFRLPAKYIIHTAARFTVTEQGRRNFSVAAISIPEAALENR